MSLTLLAFSGTDQSLKPHVRYEVYDYQNRRIREGSQPISVAARSTYSGPLALPAIPRGSFRVVLWAEEQSGPDEEVVCAVVPRPQRAGPDLTSFVGAHALASDFQYEVLQRLGVIRVTLEGLNRVATSDSEGRFIFRDVPPGSYTLRATGAALNRFRNGAASVTVPGGQRTVTVDVQLE